jgi:segregation and condensation protein B
VNPLTQLLEAAFFSAAHPISRAELARLAPDASASEIAAAVDDLRQHYEEGQHAVELIEVADGFQVVTRREFADAVAEAQLVRRPRKLSRAALETLAVIAYRQPVSRAEIEEIRGVTVEGVLRSLQERTLVQVVGRADGLGRPLLYGTTDLFLEHLGIRDLDELPRLEELSVALRPLAEYRESPES